MIITALERQKRRRRVNVYVDGAFAFAASLAVVQDHGLHEGDQVTAAELTALRCAEERDAAYNTALRLLAYRPRSDQELRDRLRRRGVPRAVIEETTARLQRLRLLDDKAFARYWVESRQTTTPRSRRMVHWELTRKGVERELTDAATAAIEDAEAARAAAAKRALRLRDAEWPLFQRRLASFLVGRGFSYGVVRRVTQELWEEVQATTSLDPATDQ